jgi:hypothetical protein
VADGAVWNSSYEAHVLDYTVSGRRYETRAVLAETSGNLDAKQGGRNAPELYQSCASYGALMWLALKILARPKRFELLTPRFVVWCSIQLSYGRVADPG